MKKVLTEKDISEAVIKEREACLALCNQFSDLPAGYAYRRIMERNKESKGIMSSIDKNLAESEAKDIGTKFLESIFDVQGNPENAISRLVRDVGYKRERSVELLEKPERLRVREIVKIAKSAGYNVKFELTKIGINGI